MTVFKIFLFIFLNFLVTFAKISDKRLCYNEDCSEPVSKAKTLLRYSSDDSRILSFKPNQEVKIFSKSAGSRNDLWGAEINGKRGYVPISHVKELKVFYTDLKFLVDTEGVDDPAVSKTATESIPADKHEKKINVPNSVVNEIPSSVTPTYEIIDGTTLYSSDPSYILTTPSNIEFSEKQISEHLAKPTIPVELDTEKIIENLKSETKSNNINTEEIKNKNSNDNEKLYDLSDEKKTDNLEVPKSKEDMNLQKQEIIKDEKKDEIIEIENESAKNADDENEEEKLYDLSDEKKTDNLEVPKSKEDMNLQKQEIIKDEKKDEIIEFENESAENADDENEEDDDDGVDVNEEEEEESAEKPVSNDFPNAQEQITKNIESTQTIKEQTSVFNVNSEVNNAEVVSDIEKKTSEYSNEKSGSLSLEQKHNLNVNNILTVMNNSPVIETTTIHTDNIKNSDTDSDMKQFDAANNESKISVNETITEESSENLKPGVPSHFPNPLNFFSSQEVKDEQNVETNTQVPEFSTSERESDDAVESVTFDSNVKNIVTTETPIVQESSTESIIENPNILLKDKTPEFIDTHESKLLNDVNSDFGFENQGIKFGEKYDSTEYSQNNIAINSMEEMSSNSVIDQTSENNENIENIQNSSENTSVEPGFFSNIFSNLFSSKQEEIADVESSENNFDEIRTEETKNTWKTHVDENPSEKYLMTEQSEMQSCKAGKDSSCPLAQNQNYIRSENGDIDWSYEIPENAYTILLYLTLTAITVLLFSLGYYYIEKRRKYGKLIASINELEQKLLVSTKECHLAQNELKITKEKLESVEDSTCGSNVALETLKEELEIVKCSKLELEEQIVNLENELEKATETGMEMSEMLNELLTSQSGGEHLMKTINGLQKQLNDQKITLNHTQSKLSEKNTENELLRTELQVTNEKVSHLQTELDKMVVNILTVQEDKSKIETDYEAQIEKLTTDHNSISAKLNKELDSLKEQMKKYTTLIEETKRELDLKSNEYDLLKQSMKEIEGVQCNNESMKALLDVSHVKAEVLQLREEKHKLSDKLQKEVEAKLFNEKEVQVILQEVQILKDKFDEAEKEKVEAETRLEVLSSYFKEREAQYQKEINENESKWMQKEGEATSTIERIKWIQEELQNYKSQNELLKKEILDQEVSLKSQISMLEKKNHENWLLARQAERKLEESKQEASQLRNRLTIVEKNLNNSSQMNDESIIQNHSNGDVAVSPLHMTNPDNPGSPPLLFPHRDHMTTSPPLQVLPPFMPPPHGVFMPPPPLTGVPPFMPPPPPPLFPGDHRPPPLGRMSSPPLHGRYSPDSRVYSPYDRDDSPPLSPTYTDDYRRRTPPPNVNHLPPRTYSPYSGKQRYWDDKMEYRGQHHRNKSRPHKGMSSGSGNSDESLENSGRHSGRV